MELVTRAWENLPSLTLAFTHPDSSELNWKLGYHRRRGHLREKASLEPQLWWSSLPAKHYLLDDQQKTLLLYVNFLHVNMNDSLCNYIESVEYCRAKPGEEYYLPLVH